MLLISKIIIITYIFTFRTMPRWGRWEFSKKMPMNTLSSQPRGTWKGKTKTLVAISLSTLPPCGTYAPDSLLPGWTMGSAQCPCIFILQKKSFAFIVLLSLEKHFSFLQKTQPRCITILTRHSLAQQIGMII